MSDETGNAVISGTMLGKEGHGIPTFSLQLDMGGISQAFGNWDLRHASYGVDLLMRVIEVVGVEYWDQLKGKNVRYRRHNALIVAIGHIVEDKWIAPEEWGKAHHEEALK